MTYTMSLSVDEENWFFVGESENLNEALGAFGYVVYMAHKDGDLGIFKLENSDGDLLRYVDLQRASDA